MSLILFSETVCRYEMCRSSVLDSGVWMTTGYTVSSLCSCLFSLNQLSWRAGCELWQSCDKYVWITRHSWFTVVGSKLSKHEVFTCVASLFCSFVKLANFLSILMLSLLLQVGEVVRRRAYPWRCCFYWSAHRGRQWRANSTCRYAINCWKCHC